MFTIKQTNPILPPRGLDPTQIREPNQRYVYLLTAFVSLGALLFGYDQGVMGKSMINRSITLAPSTISLTVARCYRG